jgi:hypothetical protein
MQAQQIFNVSRKEIANILSETVLPAGQTTFAFVKQKTEPKLLKKCRHKMHLVDLLKKEIEELKDISEIKFRKEKIEELKADAVATFSKVEKVSETSIILNSIYERAIERQLEKEGKDISAYEKGQNTMPLEYGPNNIFFGTYNERPVLQYRPNDAVFPKTVYFVDGKQTEKAEISGFLPLESKATNQGTEREILWRKVYLDNILEISLLGKKYIVID